MIEYCPTDDIVTTKITVYLQGASREYVTNMVLDEVIRCWEHSDKLIITTWHGLVYIERNQCPIVEFNEIRKLKGEMK